MAKKKMKEGETQEVRELMAALTMEFIGTFFLCLTVTTSAVLSQLAPLAIGGVLMCFIYAGAHVSGANYNPAVSFALALRGALPWPKCIMYIAVQLVASILAAMTGMALLGSPEIGHPAINLADYNYGSALLGEVCYTFALVFVVLNVATAKKNEGNQFYGIAIGFTVTAGACSSGPISGGAFNPAVGFGLTIFAGSFESVPCYIIGPMAGAALAAGAFWVTNPDEFPKTYTKIPDEDDSLPPKTSRQASFGRGPPATPASP
jgi:aquaporin Z